MTTPLAAQVRLGDRYELTEQIAVGGMGEVWRAHDRVLGRSVAVKVLKPEYAADPAFLERFRNEARHAAALSHPGIANVFDYGELGDRAYLVMECVDGEPLSTILDREGRLSPDRALDIVGQAALALQAAHDIGVVHRDMKPANLLVRPDGVVKVTDFGIARAVDAAPITKTGFVVGTAAYLSPEQAAGRPVTPASDIYSLGVVAYECLSGQRPFRAETPVALAMEHLSATPPRLDKQVPPLVADFVMAALAKEPEKRPPSASEFGRTALALSATMRAEPPTAIADAAAAPPPTKALTAATPVGDVVADEAQRRRIRNIFIAIGAVVVLLGFLALRSCGSSPSTPAPKPTPSKTAAARVTVLAGDYVGEPAATAVAALRALGLHVVQSSVTVSAEPGSVVAVSPTGSLARGATVTVYVAKAATPVQPKSGPKPPGHKDKHGGHG